MTTEEGGVLSRGARSREERWRERREVGGSQFERVPGVKGDCAGGRQDKHGMKTVKAVLVKMNQRDGGYSCELRER